MGGTDPRDRSREDSGTTTLPGTDDTPGAYARAHPVAAGTVLAGRYRIEELLGKGGMGEVYAAHDTQLDQPVAVKLLGARKNGAIRLLVREELRASEGLTHRNIARTYTLDEMDGELFIVMERLRGETLAAKQRRGPAPLADALAIIDQLLAGLAAAHARGVVHRDVKPANIMICDDGRVVLMDFGLAEMASDGPTVDRDEFGLHSVSVRGTPAYMAPEVAAGLRADVRADLYAVGLILFELVVGGPAFRARSAAELLHRQLHEPIDLSRAQAPERIVQVIAKLTAKDPADRFASADDVRAALAPPAIVSRRRAAQLAAFAVAAAAAAAILYAVTRAPKVETSMAASGGTSGSPRDPRDAIVQPGVAMSRGSGGPMVVAVGVAHETAPAPPPLSATQARRLYDDATAAFEAGHLEVARRLYQAFQRAAPGPHPDVEARLREIEARLRPQRP